MRFHVYLVFSRKDVDTLRIEMLGGEGVGVRRSGNRLLFFFIFS